MYARGMTTRTCSKTDLPDEREFHFCGLTPNHDGEHRCGYGMCTHHWPEIAYTIAVGHGLAVGAVFDNRDAAEKTAKRLRLKYYEVIPYRVTKNA